MTTLIPKFEQIGSTTVNRPINEKLAEWVSVKDFGAVGDGVTDDTDAIQAAFDSGAGQIQFPTASYFFNEITVDNPCIIDFCGSTCLGDDGTDAYWFSIQTPNVTIKNGFFGTGTQDKGIVICGTLLGTEDVSNFIFMDNSSDLAITNAKGVLVLAGESKQARVLNNNFKHSGGANTSNRVVRLQLPVGAVGTDRYDLKVCGNYFDNYFYAFDNYSTGYCGGLLFDGNTVANCGVGYRGYHIIDATVTNNEFLTNSEPVYVWQSTNCSNNTFRGATGVAAVISEANQGIISNNIIKDSDGYGLILDGGADTCLVLGNRISDCGSHGIYINPAYQYGGQVNSLRIEANFIYANVGCGIYVDAGDNIRSLFINANHIGGNGTTNVTGQAAIYLNLGTKFCDRLVIKDNIITNSDETYGVVGNTEYAVYVNAGFQSIIYWIVNNWTDTPQAFVDTRSGGGGLTQVMYNRVYDLTTIDIYNAVEIGNYDNTTV